jgi:hypothetical protein
MITVEDAIKRANEFGDRIQDLVVARKECPTTDRNTLLMAYWSMVFEFHRAILCLIHNKFYGAAFALVRPILEAVIRAHVTIMGSDEDVQKLRNDEYRTNLATIGKEIDTAFRLEGLLERLLDQGRLALHSYTHAGTMQLGRRFKGTDLMPNYSEGSLIEVIQVSTSSAFMVNNLVTKYLDFEEEWQENSKLYERWGKPEPQEAMRSACFSNLPGCDCRLVYERLKAKDTTQ